MSQERLLITLDSDGAIATRIIKVGRLFNVNEWPRNQDVLVPYDQQDLSVILDHSTDVLID